jgi:hypothetical protein
MKFHFFLLFFIIFNSVIFFLNFFGPAFSKEITNSLLSGEITNSLLSESSQSPADKIISTAGKLKKPEDKLKDSSDKIKGSDFSVISGANIDLLISITNEMHNYAKDTGESGFFKLLNPSISSRNMSIDDFLTLRDTILKKVRLFLNKNLSIGAGYKAVKDLASSYISRHKTLSELVKSEKELVEYFLSKTPVFQRWEALVKETKRIDRKLELLKSQLKETKGSETFVFNEEIAYTARRAKELSLALVKAEKEKKELIQSVTPQERAKIYLQIEEEISCLKNDINELNKIILETNQGTFEPETLEKSDNSDFLTPSEEAIIKKNLNKLTECMTNSAEKFELIEEDGE